ncbi:DegT/DnrJ/EryC1/StrS family aminotransferase [Flavobacterium hydatis]|uniref:DegT/DnrJ/EryC1/StrS family aminotransferase n=1 Tax=Flavobacterium hydatis TaxID=991 RepID=UPI002934D6C1|nr:DegT/DnrJ/EryC1/StrS family aminotransferase [Flavobacterium hydatis]
MYLFLSQKSGFEQSYIQKALETNCITSGGQYVDELEKVLEDYLKEETFIAALNLGTSAIHLALLNVK